MYMEAELLLKSYKPLFLEKGQLFVRKLFPGSEREHIELWALDKFIPADEAEMFMQSNGAPVELFIMDDDFPIAMPEDIGWFDEGEHTDELRDVTLTDLNTILNVYGGRLGIEVDECGVPTYEEDKVTLTFPQEE